MPLNVPHDHLIANVVMYDPATPPMLPPVEVPPEVQGIVPIVAVELINQLGMKAAQSPVRRALYNMVVMNNFLNNDFRGLLEMTVLYILLCYKKGYNRNVQEGIQERVGELIALWISNLLVITPELKAACSPQTVYAAHQNVQTFANLKQEIQAMMNQFGSNQQWGYPNAAPPVGGPMVPGSWMTNSQGQQVFVPHQQQQQNWGGPQTPAAPSGYWAQDPYGRQIFVQGTPPGAQAPQWQHQQQQHWAGPQGGFSYQAPVTSGGQYYGAAPLNVTDSSKLAKDVALQGRFMGQLSRHNPQQQEVQQPQQQQMVDRSTGYKPVHHVEPQWKQHNQPVQVQELPQEEAPQTVEPASKDLIINGGSEMDRAAHSVAYFGETANSGVVERQKAFTQSAEDLSKTNAAVMELPDGVDDVPDTNQFVSGSVCYDVIVESLELQAKLKYMESRDGDEPSPVYRIFGKAAVPFAGRKVLKNTLQSLLTANSVTRLADQMKRLMKEALTSKGGLRSADDQDVIAYLNFLDRVLTQKVNTILECNLQANLRIESFTTDVGSVGEFLQKKRGAKFGYGWDFCINNLMNIFTDAGEETLISAIEENYIPPEGMCMVPTPTAVSFTFTELTLKELGFKFTEKLMYINPETAPALYKVAASLQKHKKEMGLTTEVDYLVTSDGVKYILHKNQIESGINYWIAEA